MSYEPIRLETDGAVARLTLDRPAVKGPARSGAAFAELQMAAAQEGRKVTRRLIAA
jgi:hypothetical protein